MKIKGSSKIIRVFLIVTWLIAFAFIYISFLRYTIKSEKVSEVEVRTEWLNGRLHQGKDTLIFFLHPKCSCSVASIAELKEVLTEINKPLNVIAIISVRSSVDPEFLESESVKDILNIKGVEVFYDIGSVETIKLGVNTSGHTMFYNSFGELQFSGGITASRGHRGESIGERELIKKIENISKDSKFLADVYGCGFGSDFWKER